MILEDGRLVAWLGRAERNLLTYLPETEPERTESAKAVAAALAALVSGGRRRVLLVGKIDGDDPAQSPLAPFVREAGFHAGSRGYLMRTPPRDAEGAEVRSPKSRVTADA